MAALQTWGNLGRVGLTPQTLGRHFRPVSVGRGNWGKGLGRGRTGLGAGCNPSLGKWRQDGQEFEASLRSAWTTRDPVSKEASLSERRLWGLGL